MTVSIRASLLISAFAMAALTAAFAAPSKDSVTSDDEAKAPAHPTHWAYHGEAGPDRWGDLAPANKPCNVGLQQSPIDLAGAVSASVAAPIPKWIPVHGGTVLNNGHTLQVNTEGAGGIRLAGTEYALKQFHFHHPSEHTIDGKSFPLEIHFVHATPDGELAVIGVMVEEGDANPALDPIWSTAPVKEGETAMVATIDPMMFMPSKVGVFRYEGSLTTPPCSETVHWTVMSAPITASAGQLAAFASLFPMNARPVQPLNRRYILKTSG